MAKEAQQEIKTPKNAQVRKEQQNLRIFTMPEKYRHGAEVKMVEPQKVVKAQVTPPPPPPPPKRAPTAPLQQPKKASKVVPVILVLLFLAVIGLGFAGFFYFQSTNQPQVEPSPVVTPTPTPTPTPQPIPQPDPEPQPRPDTTPSPFPRVTAPGLDTDSDGLSNLEENLIYQTDERRPDSDADGFLDGNEVFHRYNPNGDAPGTLAQTGLVKRYEASGEGDAVPYSILYPSGWALEVNAQSPRDAIFAATTGERISLVVRDKDFEQTITEWFQDEGIDEQVDLIETKNGFPMLVSEDQLMAFVNVGDFVVVFTYDAGVKGVIDYLQTYKMMINSLE